MNCKEAQPNLLEYSRGLLSPRDSQLISRHIESCPECRALLEEELHFAQRLSAVPSPEPDSERVWSLVQSQITVHPRPSFIIDIITSTLAKRIVAAAGALVALVIAMVLLLPGPTPPQNASMEARVAEAAQMMRVQPVDQVEPSGTTEDMINILQNEINQSPINGGRS